MKREMNDYSVKSKQSIEELFRNKNLSFEDIENLEL
jgi:cell envelope opacity-associated protein A